MKRTLRVLALILVMMLLTACGKGKDKESKKAETHGNVIKYHFADKDEAVSCYLSNEKYFEGFSLSDIQYRIQKSDGTIKELKEFGAAQMDEFSEDEKTAFIKVMEEMETDLKNKGYTLPKLDEIIFIKSTQLEEGGGSAAYTHGTQIYLGQLLINYICSEGEPLKEYGKTILWHEIFHCLTRNDPDFRKEMYKIIGFTVQDEDFVLPPSVSERYISNPDVEHHNAYATFRINGKDVDCYLVFTVSRLFEKEGDSFFNYQEVELVPVDGSDTYYRMGEAENFWELFGENTEYVIDPEECLADNFAYAMMYGVDGKYYYNPEIIQAILDVISK